MLFGVKGKRLYLRILFRVFFSICSHKAFIEGSNVGFGGDPDWFLVIRWFPPPENWVKLNSKCYKGSSW